MVVTPEKIDEAESFCRAHFGQELFNRSGWEHILRAHGGKLPVTIAAVPEGAVIPESNVLLTIRNTDPRCAWLVNHLETLLVQLWYPSTVATISREMKKILLAALQKTGDPGTLPHKLHDFGCRGAAMGSAAIGGAAHLVNFQSTDTIAAIELLRRHYGADMPAVSVPAAEHSTICAWGENGEEDAYRHILKEFPTGIVSVVSDSWDVMNACDRLWGGSLADEIIGKPRTLVVRPDSGDPTKTLSGVLNILARKLGFRYNAKGYKVLANHVRVIQGDGITRRSLPEILDVLIAENWSIDNLTFGSGGGLLTDCSRDTLRFAMKCCWTVRNGRPMDVSKRPRQDPSKSSKAGLLKLIRDDTVRGGYRTVPDDYPEPNVLGVVFRDGAILDRWTLNDIRLFAETW